MSALGRSIIVGGESGDISPGLLFLGFIFFVGVSLLIVWAINPDIFKFEKEGDDCEGDDEKGIYEIDEDGKCVLVSCDYGWEVDGKECVKAAPSATIPSATTPSATITNSCTGQCQDVLTSPNGLYRVLMQGDGHLVMRDSNDALIWGNGVHGIGTGPYKLYMQGDGHLVVRDSNGDMIWGNGAHGIGTGPYTLYLQDDRHLIVRDSNGAPIWGSGTAIPSATTTTNSCTGQCQDVLTSPNGLYRVLMQGDGHLVMRDSNDALIWGNGVHGIGTGPYKLYMQGDGHLVVRDSNGDMIWGNGAHGIGTGPYTLYLQDDRHLIVRDSNGAPIWGSGTAI